VFWDFIFSDREFGVKERWPLMKKVLRISLFLVLAVVIVFVGISGYLGYSMTRVKRVPLERSPAALNLAYENISFPSLDKELTLHGWFLHGFSMERVVIMVHGNGMNRDDPTIGTLDIAAQLVEHGYNVLMFDLRGYGESDGNTVSGGYYERRDLEGAVDYVKGRGFQHIGVLGFSLGAVTSLLAGAEDRDIDAIVSDSSFADLKDIMEPEFSRRTHAPQFFLHPILFMIKIMYRVDFTAIRPIDSVAKITPRPIFFIHGEADETIPVAHAYRLLQASQNSQDELWIVPGAGHTKSYITHPEEYISRVTTFFDTALK
jgi:dipeptidyl aminopeptidase/acylaminoacyl peptidase